MNDKQAQDFLTKYRLRFRSVQHADRCPPYCALEGGGHPHGHRYRVTISRKGGGRLSFDFWNSRHDIERGDTTIRPYDALACIGGDVHTADTFEEFCSEYGYDADSRKAEKTWKLCDRFAQRIRAFFTEDEIEALSEIQ